MKFKTKARQKYEEDREMNRIKGVQALKQLEDHLNDVWVDAPSWSGLKYAPPLMPLPEWSLIPCASSGSY